MVVVLTAVVFFAGHRVPNHTNLGSSGFFWGGGGGLVAADAPFSGIRHAETQMVPPLYYLEISIFGEVPLNFPYILIFDVGARHKKTRFFGQIFPKNA